MFSPHPNLADEVNRSIIQSEIEGGVFLDDLPPSTVLQIQTLHHCYTAVLLGGSEALLSGHPEFCPEPVQVAISGSTWGGSMLKLQYVGRGMHLEFRHPQYATPIITSPIQEIRDSQPIPVAASFNSLRTLKAWEDPVYCREATGPSRRPARVDRPGQVEHPRRLPGRRAILAVRRHRPSESSPAWPRRSRSWVPPPTPAAPAAGA